MLPQEVAFTIVVTQQSMRIALMLQQIPFYNETNSTITANECNIIYTTSYTDNGTITCNDEIEVIDIARPDANWMSNNSYNALISLRSC